MLLTSWGGVREHGYPMERDEVAMGLCHLTERFNMQIRYLGQFQLLHHRAIMDAVSCSVGLLRHCISVCSTAGGLSVACRV